MLKTLIFSLTDEDSYIRKFFLVVLGDIVRSASKAERQSLKPYISKKYTKKRNPVFPTFSKAYCAYFTAVGNSSDILSGDQIEWVEGDATTFSVNRKVDVAITSPPYINAMDYVRCIKLESAWIGTGDDNVFSKVRTAQLGEAIRSKTVEPNEITQTIASPFLTHLLESDVARFRTALSYFQDMQENLRSVGKSLRKGGTYHVIVGDSVIRGREVPTHKIIAEIGEAIGLKWSHHVKYPIKDHRTSLPRNGNGGKISEEHVVSLCRV